MKLFSKYCVVGALLALAGTTSALAADSFPSRPIRIIVGSTPGGMIDITTRVLAERMGKELGQSVVVENKPGAGTTISVRYVKAAPADGYTLLAATSTIAIQPSVMRDPGYDLVKDFTGIGPTTRFPLLMLVGHTQPFKSLDDFIAQAKASPGKFTYATSGVGGSIDLATIAFAQRAGVKITQVPYKGNSASYADLIGGRVTLLFEAYGAGAAMMHDGRVKALGVTSTKRLQEEPNVPTMAEQGLPGFSEYLWMGLFAPTGTPANVVQRLSKALENALKAPDLQERFRNDSEEPMLMSPDEFNKFVKGQTVSIAKLVSDLGIPKH